jgi:glycosyltransferase involved in cell wall biosynthesis
VKPSITLGLCVRSCRENVQTALESISIQDYPHELMKLVVVCEETTQEALTKLSDYVKEIDVKAIVLSSGGKGLGASRQIVVDNAEGKYILWVDDDFVLQYDFVKKHVEFMEKNSRVGAALAHQIANRNTFVAKMEGYLELISTVNQRENPTGGFEIFRLQSMNQAGGYDRKIRGAGEDGDIASRIKSLGWQLTRNDEAIYRRRSPPMHLRNLWRKHFWYGYGNHFLFHKYSGRKVSGELFFPFSILIGLRDSIKIYKINRERMVFLLSPYYFFRSSARFFGFLFADLDHYGHAST